MNKDSWTIVEPIQNQDTNSRWLSILVLYLYFRVCLSLHIVLTFLGKICDWAFPLYRNDKQMINVVYPNRFPFTFSFILVECRTPEREVGGSKPTSAVLCPWARHFTPRKYWLIAQEAVAPSRHDWKIVDWDVKPQHKQTNKHLFWGILFQCSWGSYPKELDLLFEIICLFWLQ